MKHSTGSFQTQDGLTLFSQKWLPESQAKAAILIIHGYGEHSNRYSHVATFFVKQGYQVYSYDHRGHGQSEGRMAYVNRFTEFLDDLSLYYAEVQAQAGDLPLFLLGHSMGGGILTHFCLDRKPQAKGIILSGALLMVSKDISPLLVKISSFLSVIAPKLKTIKLDSSAVSRDPAVVKAYDEDPLVYHGGTYARTGGEINASIKWIAQHMEAFDYPVLIMHASDDRLTEPDGSRMLHEKARSKDKELKIYEGFYHEILNEPEQEQVMTDINAWIKARL